MKRCEIGRSRPAEAFRQFGKKDQLLLGGLRAYLSIKSPKSPPSLDVRCEYLLAAMELQAVLSILGGHKTVQCIECPRWFEVGSRCASVAVEILFNAMQGQLPQPPQSGGKEVMTMRNTGHIRQRTRGAFELRYDFGTDPATGKRRIATATVRGDREAAEKELRRLLRTLDNGEHVDPLAYRSGNGSSSGLILFGRRCHPRRMSAMARLSATSSCRRSAILRSPSLRRSHIQAPTTGGHQAGVATARLVVCRRRRVGTSTEFFGPLFPAPSEQQVIARNPADAFKKRLPKVERRTLITLTADQSARLLEAIAHSRVYWPVLLALSTGMRRGEVLAVRWKNVDLELGTLRVMESLEQTKTGIRFKAPKSGRHRAITLPAYAVEELRRLKRQQAEALLALGVRQTGETLLCCRADGEPHQPLSLTYEFARFMGRMKDLPRVRFHDLRHSHATQLLASGVHPKIASERLGHASVGITLDLYSHVTDTMQSEAALKLDSAMQVAKSRLAGPKIGSDSNSGSNKPVTLSTLTGNTIDINHIRPRGGVVTQRSAKPFTPVQFRAWPPLPGSDQSPQEKFQS